MHSSKCVCTCVEARHRSTACVVHSPCAYVQPAHAARRLCSPHQRASHALLQGGAAVLGEAGLQTVKDMAVHLYGKVDVAFRTVAPHLRVRVSAEVWAWAGAWAASAASKAAAMCWHGVRLCMLAFGRQHRCVLTGPALRADPTTAPLCSPAAWWLAPGICCAVMASPPMTTSCLRCATQSLRESLSSGYCSRDCVHAIAASLGCRQDMRCLSQPARVKTGNKTDLRCPAVSSASCSAVQRP